MTRACDSEYYVPVPLTVAEIDSFKWLPMPKVEVVHCALPAGHAINHITRRVNGEVVEWPKR